MVGDHVSPSHGLMASKVILALFHSLNGMNSLSEVDVTSLRYLFDFFTGNLISAHCFLGRVKTGHGIKTIRFGFMKSSFFNLFVSVLHFPHALVRTSYKSCTNHYAYVLWTYFLPVFFLSFQKHFLKLYEEQLWCILRTFFYSTILFFIFHKVILLMTW